MTPRIELVGPAGVGKTTLVSALGGSAPADIAKPAYARYAAASLVAHAPAMVRTRSRLTWPELRSTVYVTAWLELDASGASGVAHPAADPTPLTYDHGPLYRIATLGWFGTPACQREWRGRRGEEAIDAWSNALDLAVVLDAPDDVLVERIEGRAQDHRMKGRPRSETVAFLDRYRAAFDEVLDRLDTRVLRLDTRDTPQQLAAQIRLALAEAASST